MIDIPNHQVDTIKGNPPMINPIIKTMMHNNMIDKAA